MRCINKTSDNIIIAGIVIILIIASIVLASIVVDNNKTKNELILMKASYTLYGE